MSVKVNFQCMNFVLAEKHSCLLFSDKKTILVSDPEINGQCMVFPPGYFSDISFWQTFTITDPTSKGYSVLSYKLVGPHECKDKELLFSTTKGDSINCKRTRSCQYLQEMSNVNDCFRTCPCDNGHCQSIVVVGPIINSAQWELCSVQLT